MQPEVQFGNWFVIDVRGEATVVPQDVVGDLPIPLKAGERLTSDEVPTDLWAKVAEALQPYVEGTIGEGLVSVELREAWGGRWSAPGYLDCTDWELFESKEEAEEALRDEGADE